MTVTSHRAKTGETLWTQKLSETGTLQGGLAGVDRRTLAVHSDTNGGRVYLLRDGRLVNTFMTPADDLALTLGMAPSHFGGYAFAAGEPKPGEGATVVKKADAPPTDWQVVRVDLWGLGNQPLRIRSINFGVIGGGAAFDRIRLGRTAADLP